MENIQPVGIWNNGSVIQATKFSLEIIYDNLIDNANFYYQLISDNGVPLSTGNLSITGTEYETWGESSDVNQEAYVICTTKLGLQL